MTYWVIMALLLLAGFILRKTIANTIGGIVIFIGLMFLLIAMIDTFTGADVRKFLNLRQYDETVEDPVKKAKEVGDKVVNEGKKLNDGIENAGSYADKKLGVDMGNNENKMWSKKEITEESSKEVNDKKGTYKTNKKDNEKELESKKNVIIKIEDVDKYIKANNKELTKKDKDLLRGVNNLLTKTLKGDNIEVNQKNGDIAIKYIK